MLSAWGAVRLVELPERGMEEMKTRLQATFSVASLVLGLLSISMASTQNANAQNGSDGYQLPRFFGAAMQNQKAGMSPRGMPPASPLAGGMPAAHGDAFMDAHRNPIVKPVSYYQSGPGGGSPTYPGSGYGDPMAMDFGGSGAPDQSGPYYFDFRAEAIFLQAAGVFSNVPAFTSVGVGAAAGVPTNPQLNPTGSGEDYEAGFQITGRIDLGPLSVFEATYMGLYDFGFTDTVRSVEVAPGNQDNQLFSIFSQFGFAPLIPQFDQASIQQLRYESELESAELSYRRYWVGANSRVSGTYLAGFRYLRMTENFAFSSSSNFAGNGSVSFASENDLLGFQFGGDGSICLRQGLRLDTEGKAGIYNNRFKFESGSDVAGIAPNLQPASEGNQVAFVAEAGVALVADILPSISIRSGYRVLYMNSLVKVGDNLATAAAPSGLATQGDALYHGFHGGIEYIW